MALEGLTVGSRGKTNDRACSRGLLDNRLVRPILQDWTKGRGVFLEPCDVRRSTRRVEPANGPDKIDAGFWGRLSLRSAGLVPDLNTFGLWRHGGATLNRDL
jgi:hypothetical protein